MNIMRGYTLRTVIGIYSIALLLFTMALQLVEVVTNLVRYIHLAVPLISILEIQLYFLPSSLHFALPIAMLFAVSFSIGNFYSTHELLAVYGIGISLARFCMPIFMFAAIMSIFSFVLEDVVIVKARAQYHALRESVLLISAGSDSDFVALFGGDGNDVYYAEKYDSDKGVLTNPTFIERDTQGTITRRISANTATWDGEYWILDSAHSYTWEDANIEVAHRMYGRARFLNLDITPASFDRADLEIEEMNITQAREHIIARRRSGLPFRKELTVYHERFAFACTSLVVALIACGIGGLLRRNTLLLSMLISLCVTVVYYVLGLIMDLLAFNGYVSPVFAAWFPVSMFLLGATVTLRNIGRA